MHCSCYLFVKAYSLDALIDLQKCIKLSLNLYYGHCSGGVIAFSHCSINTPLSTNAFDVNGHIRKQRTRESVRINLGEEFLAAVLTKAF